MATVGNLFVTVGANTGGLQQGLQKATKDVDKFAKSAAAVSNRAAAKAFDGWGSINVPLPGGLAQQLDPGAAIAGLMEARNRLQALGKDTEQVTAATKRLADAQKALRDTTTLRRSMGATRATVARAGFDPDKLRLKTEDVSGLKGGVTAALASLRQGKATLEQNRAAIVEADKATQGLKNAKRALTRAQEAETKATSAAYAAMARAKSAPEAFRKAQEKLTAATEKTRMAQERLTALEGTVAKGTAARQALAASEDAVTKARERLKVATDALAKAQERNAKIEALRSKVRAAGFDPDKVAALRLPDLGALKEQVAQAEGVLASAKIDQSMTRIASSMKAAGVATVAAVAAFGAMVGMTGMMAAKMGDLEDQAVSLGMSIEGFQQLQTAMRFLGAAPGSMERAVGLMGVQVQALADGNETAVASFKRLGLAVNDFDGKTVEEQFRMVIGRIQQLGSQSEKVAALRDIFGKGALGLRAVVQATAEQMREASEYASKFVLPAAIVKDLAKTDDQLALVRNGLEGAAAIVAHSFAPAMKAGTDAMIEFLTQDVESLRQQLGGLAATVAVIADVLAVIANLIQLIFNTAQVLAGVVVGGIVTMLATAVKSVEWIAYGFELVTGSAHEASAAIGEVADALAETAKETVKGMGEDATEAMSAAMDMGSAMSGQSTRAVIDALTQPLKQAAESVPRDMLNIGAQTETRNIKEASKALETLQEQVNKLRMGEQGAARAEFLKTSPSAPDIARFDTLQREQKELEDHNAFIEEMTKRAEDAQGELQKLRDDVAALGKTEEQTIVDKIAAVLPHARAEAERLAETLKQAKISEDLKSHFSKLNEELLKAQMNEEGMARATLSAMGLTGAALEQAVAKTLDIQKQIQSAKDAQAAADEAKQKREADAKSVTDTIASLTKELRQIDMTDAEKVADDLRELGASASQIETAKRLQEQITARGGKDKDLVDMTASLDTALGAVKVAMPFDPVVAELARQEEIQREQLETLNEIHSSLERRTPVSDMESTQSARSAATVDQPVAGMDRCCAEQLAELRAQTAALRAIALNTDGLGKALT